MATVTAPTTSNASVATAASGSAHSHQQQQQRSGLLAPTASSAAHARTFVNRPRKETAPAAAPVQHHSYLSHTAARRAGSAAPATQPVHAMASFLRPTAASWGRTQREQQEAAAAAAKAKASGLRAGGATGPVRASSAVLGRVVGKGKPPTGTGVGVTVVGRGGGKIEATEERELRLAREAQERIRKVGLCWGGGFACVVWGWVVWVGLFCWLVSRRVFCWDRNKSQ